MLHEIDLANNKLTGTSSPTLTFTLTLTLKQRVTVALTLTLTLALAPLALAPTVTRHPRASPALGADWLRLAGQLRQRDQLIH